MGRQMPHSAEDKPGLPEAAFYGLIENAPVGVFLVDSHLRIASASAAACKFFDAAHLVGKDLADLISARAGRAAAIEVIARFRHTLATGELHRGSEFPGSVAAPDAVMQASWSLSRTPLPSGEAGVLCHLEPGGVDLLALEQLKGREALYRDIVESQADMVCRFRPEGTILFANAAYARALNVSPDELSRANFWDFVAPEDRESVRDTLGRLSPDAPQIQIENRFETAEGARWTLWTNSAVRFDAEGALIEAQSTGIDITERKRVEEHRKLLVDELNHRVKNTLAVVQGIAQQTFSRDVTSYDSRRAFEGRLSALSVAHNLLTRAHWDHTPLQELARDLLNACGAGPQQLTIEGPAIHLEPRQTIALALAFNELCTNAIKYGALSAPEGRVMLTWSLDEDRHMEIIWREEQGPQVVMPRRRGFGTLMIERALAHDIQGKAALEFLPGGVVCTILVPLKLAA